MNHMHVYVNGRLVVIETNIAWALPYWQKQRSLRERDGTRITWVLTSN